jgi:nucleoside 2-deoxyribosyltransferase
VKVYCAGPLFNPKEKEEMQEIAQVLERDDFRTFLPQRDGLLFEQLLPILMDKSYKEREAVKFLNQAIFVLDVYEVLVDCDSLVVNLNGRVPDEGAVAEAAMAWIWGKPVLIYKNDARSLVVGQDNPLVSGLSDFLYANKIQEIPKALKALGVKSQKQNISQFPEKVRAKLEQGRKIAKALLSAVEMELIALIIDLFG